MAGERSDERICAIDASSLARAVRLLRAGELVVIPTDTVYGIACDPGNPQALAAMFAAKHRPTEKSVQVLLPTLDVLGEWGLFLPASLGVLAQHFCPGGFTAICVADERCPFVTVREPEAVGASRTQGVRIPASADALRILEQTGPLATSSANISGEPAAQTVDQALAAFGDAVALYLDGGPTPGPVASTVVAADVHAEGGIRILREGVISADEVFRALHEG